MASRPPGRITDRLRNFLRRRTIRPYGETMLVRRGNQAVSMSVKQNPVARVIHLGLSGLQKVWHPTDIASLAMEGYEQNPSVAAAVNLIARTTAAVPWVLFQRGKAKRMMSPRTRAKAMLMSARSPVLTKALKADRTEVDDHNLLRLIERPNPMQGQAEFLTAHLSYLEYSGNNYQTIVGPMGDSQAAEMWTFRPDRMTVVPGPQGPAGYIYTINGKDKAFKRQDILHMKTWAPLNDWYGLSPIQIAARAVDGSNLVARWNNALLANGGRPSGALISKDPQGFTDEQFNRIKDQLDEEITGVDNAGNPLVLDSLEWQEFSLSPKDMDWLQQKKATTTDIAVIYGLAPELLGVTDAKKFANYQEARKSLYMEVILPLLDWLRDEWNSWLVPRFGDNLFLDYDRDQIEALQEDQGKLFDRAERSSFLTVDEKREMTGFEALGTAKGGDAVVVSSAQTTLELVVNPPTPEPVDNPFADDDDDDDPKPGDGDTVDDEDIVEGVEA